MKQVENVKMQTVKIFIILCYNELIPAKTI